MAAAISAKQTGAKRVLIIERDRELGGILQQCIHNGFGLRRFEKELTGPGYAHRYIEMVKSAGIDVWLDSTVLSADPGCIVTSVNPDKGLRVVVSSSVVHAMGCRERTRGAIRIPGSRPAGVFTAGAAQRMVNMEGYLPGRKVVIIGSGDIGLIMARRMTLEGAKVEAVFEILPYSNGLNRNIVQCLEDFGIPLYLSHSVVAVHGVDRVTGVTVARVDESMNPIAGTEFDVDCDCVLLSVGLIPENELGRASGLAGRFCDGRRNRRSVPANLPSRLFRRRQRAACARSGRLGVARGRGRREIGGAAGARKIARRRRLSDRQRRRRRQDSPAAEIVAVGRRALRSLLSARVAPDGRVGIAASCGRSRRLGVPASRRQTQRNDCRRRPLEGHGFGPGDGVHGGAGAGRRRGQDRIGDGGGGNDAARPTHSVHRLPDRLRRRSDHRKRRGRRDAWFHLRRRQSLRGGRSRRAQAHGDDDRPR